MSEPIPETPDAPDVAAARALVALVELIHTDPIARVLLAQPDNYYASPYISISHGKVRFTPAEGTAGTEQLAAVRELFGDGEVTIEQALTAGEEYHRLHTTWRGAPLVVKVVVKREDELEALRKQVAELTARNVERAAALVEQRHQLNDPSVPPLAVVVAE